MVELLRSNTYSIQSRKQFHKQIYYTEIICTSQNTLRCPNELLYDSSGKFHLSLPSHTALEAASDSRFAQQINAVDCNL